MYRFKMVFQYRKGETIDWSNPHSVDADTFEEAAAILFKQKDVPPMIVKEIELISQTPILTRTQLFNLAHPNFEG